MPNKKKKLYIYILFFLDKKQKYLDMKKENTIKGSCPSAESKLTREIYKQREKVEEKKTSTQTKNIYILDKMLMFV